MKRWLKNTKSCLLRLFLVYCVTYTLISVLFDHRQTNGIGISETACTPTFIDAASPEELKQFLLDEFAPTLVFSFGEPANIREEVIVPYQLLLDPQNTGRYVWRGAITYPTDYGATSFGVRLTVGMDSDTIMLSKTVLRTLGRVFGKAHVDAHMGDVEMFELYLKPSSEKGYWEIDSLTTFPHGKAKTYRAAQIRCFRDSPIFYISRGKHAIYPSLKECNHSSIIQKQGIHLIAEFCNVGELYYPSTSPEFNVGDSSHPNNIFETSPTLLESEIYLGEDVWGNCFWGGHGDGEDNGPCRSRFYWW
ncbi:MAG: hypothetical protein JXA10_03360 [Anaerolineae bacterium]|nr:hypothetical protein [Anaerolineae bacterium]